MGMFDKKAGAATKPTKPVAGAVKKAAFGSKPTDSKKPTAKGKSASREVDDDDDVDDDLTGGVTSGWGGAKKLKAEYSGFANRLSMKEETIVGRFLDDAPYANVATHWTTGKNRRSYICLGAKICPLCHLGDKAKVSYNFNFLKLTTDEPVLFSWEVGVTLLAQIEKEAGKLTAKGKSLSDAWFTVERSGMGKNDTSYTLKVVKNIEDLDDDAETAGLHVPTAREIAAIKGYTKDDALKGRESLAKMREVAAAMSGEGEYDGDDDDD